MKTLQSVLSIWLHGVQMTRNPFTSQLLNASELLRGLSPAMVRQVLPLLDQLTPIYTDLAQGRLEFVPEPEETKRLIRTFYGEPCLGRLPCMLPPIAMPPATTPIFQQVNW